MLRFAPRAAQSACLALSLVALAACGGEPTAPPPEPVAEEISTVELEPAAPATDPERLIFAHPDDATKLDPADVTDSESLLVTWHLYEGLTRYVPGTTEIEPWLATAWTTSDDGLEWTFTLREGVTFHDGTPFDAEAVVWNFQRWSDKAHPMHFADWEFTYWEYMFQGFAGDLDDAGEPKSVVAGIEAVDPTTVKLTLNRPSAPLLQNLAMGNFGFSSPAAVEASGANYGTPAGNPISAGTGPYMVEEWMADDHITVVAYDGYWGDAPETVRIEFSVIPDGSARYLSLATGEIDGMNQVNPEDIAQAEENDDIAVVLEPANNVGYLGFNQAHAPWDNLNCRLAVAHAIDKQAIVDTLYAGDAVVASQMMPPSLWGYNEGIEDWPNDLDAANAYMTTCRAEATVPDEVVFYVPPIQRFYFPKPKELGEWIQASLAGIGIVTRIESPEWGSTYIPDVRAGKHDLFLLGWGGDNGDPDNFLCQFFCGADASFNGDAEGNGLPPSVELDTLLREAATLSDQAARAAAYEQANAMIHDTVPSVPLVHRSPPVLFRSNVTGYTPSPLQTILTRVAKQ